jgi:hypothetical protein
VNASFKQFKIEYGMQPSDCKCKKLAAYKVGRDALFGDPCDWLRLPAPLRDL